MALDDRKKKIGITDLPPMTQSDIIRATTRRLPPPLLPSHGPGVESLPSTQTYREGSAQGLLPGSLPGATSTLTGRRRETGSIIESPRETATAAGKPIPISGLENLRRPETMRTGGTVNWDPFGGTNFREYAPGQIPGGGRVPGGNVSQMRITGTELTPEESALQQELTTRRNENIEALDSYNRTLDYANMREGAHGAQEGARVTRRIQAMETARRKGIADPLEAEKTRSEIAANKSRAGYYDAQATEKNKTTDERAREAGLKAMSDYKGIDTEGANEAYQNAYDAVIETASGKSWRSGEPEKEGGWFGIGARPEVQGAWEKRGTLAAMIDPNDTRVIRARAAGYNDDEIAAFLRGRG